MIRTLFASAALAAVVSTPVYGQLIQRATNEDVRQPTDTAGRMGLMSPERNDRRIVRWLAVDNRMMVDCARMAADKSHDESIKQFARTVAADHEREWGALAGTDLHAGNDEQGTETDGRKIAALVSDDGKPRASEVMFRPTDFVAVKERICNRMHERAKTQFEAMDARAFDKSFLVHMQFAHEGMLATIEEVDDNASDKIQPHLKAMHEMTERHLADLGKLQERLQVTETADKPEPTQNK